MMCSHWLPILQTASAVVREVLCISDKDLSAAGGVGQGTLRPTDRQRATSMSLNVPCSPLHIAQWVYRDTSQSTLSLLLSRSIFTMKIFNCVFVLYLNIIANGGNLNDF